MCGALSRAATRVPAPPSARLARMRPLTAVLAGGVLSVRPVDSQAEPGVAVPAAIGSNGCPRKARRDAATIRRLRVRAGAMFSEGMRQGEVAAPLGEARAMVWRWHQIWSPRGMAGLTAPRRSGSRVKLTAVHLAAVDAALSAGPAANGFAVATWSLERVASVIEAVTWVKTSPPCGLPPGGEGEMTAPQITDHGHAHTIMAAAPPTAGPIRAECPVACLARVLSPRVSRPGPAVSPAGGGRARRATGHLDRAGVPRTGSAGRLRGR